MPRKLLIKKSLSKGVLGMKFMQKSKEIRDKEEDRKESYAILSANIPKLLKSAGVEIRVVHSYIELEELTSGRVSFKGMNPVVERIMQAEQEAKIQAFLDAERLKSNQADISDEAMADILSKNMQGRFNTKRCNREMCNDEASGDEESEEHVKKPKFLKPKDD